MDTPNKYHPLSPNGVDDETRNTSGNPAFDAVLQARLSRRTFFRGSFAAAAATMLGPGLAVAQGLGNSGALLGRRTRLMDFSVVAKHTDDYLAIPNGYTAQVLYRLGDPISHAVAEYLNDGSESAASFEYRAGDHHDGMHYFGLNHRGTGPNPGNAKRGLLVMNHENITQSFLHSASEVAAGFSTSSRVPAQIDKEVNVHGISVIEVVRDRDGFEIDKGSRYNRRFTAASPMDISGPARGHAMMATRYSPTGTMTRGTLNNCANGYTPWGTYLTCEENFNGYFGTTSGSDTRNDSMKRYGISALGSGYRWEEFDDRFDYVKEPNESNRFGWIVEIDPYDPVSIPKKRTALGRFKHENAALTISRDGYVVVYLGDDQANDYIYKFVSTNKFDALNMAANRNLLDSGKLYVAKFGNGAVTGDAMGTAEWILLDKTANATLAADARFADQAEVLVKTRLAADAVGATKMDRPEWVAVHPTTKEVYCTLTNNSGRVTTDDANPRAANRFGQIIRWREAGGDPASVAAFEWDLFVIAGNPIAYPAPDARAGSAAISATNTFNSPDGLAFDKEGRLWIQTDGNYSNTGHYAGQGNNQMLVADTRTGQIQRFLVGPAGCEITGIDWTPDGKTMFINVQHPGEAAGHPNAPVPPAGTSLDEHLRANPTSFSTWPDRNPDSRPRSATVVISRIDGQALGL
jgi:secreted PhoX family phosphatase